MIAVDGSTGTREEADAVRTALLERGLWRADRPVLLDLRQATVAGVPLYAEMRERVLDWFRLATPPPRRCAIVTRGGALFGIARMIASIWQGDIALFLDKDEAVAWLLADGAADDPHADRA